MEERLKRRIADDQARNRGETTIVRVVNKIGDLTSETYTSRFPRVTYTRVCMSDALSNSRNRGRTEIIYAHIDWERGGLEGRSESTTLGLKAKRGARTHRRVRNARK